MPAYLLLSELRSPNPLTIFDFIDKQKVDFGFLWPFTIEKEKAMRTNILTLNDLSQADFDQDGNGILVICSESRSPQLWWIEYNGDSLAVEIFSQVQVIYR